MQRSQKRAPRVGNTTQAAKEKKKNKPKIEFKKLLLIWVIGITTVCIISSYILSACGMESTSDIPTEMIRTCLGAIIGYCIATLGEKNSRNKYGIGPDGMPIRNSTNEEEDIEYEAETNGSEG